MATPAALILTGGDPLSRKDIYPLIDYANGLGLEVSITPSATPELTNEAIAKLKAHGIQSLGLSLDGSAVEKHDNIRAVPGTFERTMEAARHCGRLGIPIQVNTLVAEETADDLPAIYELLAHEFSGHALELVLPDFSRTRQSPERSLARRRRSAS